MQNAFKKASMYNDTDYSIHNHADALILKESSINSIINNMRLRKIPIAVRGRGFGWYYKYSPIGMIDDHFLFVSNKLIQDKIIFKQDALELIPTRNNIHGILAMFVLSNIGLKNTIFHSNVNELISWDKQKINMLGNYMRPMSYDSKLGFLHINNNSFSKNHGKSLLAHYLKSHNITKGPQVEYIINKYSIDKQILFEELKDLENFQNKKLKQYLFDIDNLSRDFSYKSKLINNITYKTIYLNLIKKIKDKLLKNLDCVHKNNSNIYPESLREKNLRQYYKYHFNDMNENIKFLSDNNII